MNDPYRVLIVEDNRRHAELMAGELRELPFPAKPIHCGSGATALRIIASEQIDLALLDFGLPDINGIDLLKEIKQLRTDLPVVFVTSEESISTAVEAMKLGAYDYIIKDDRYLVALPVVIEEVIERRRLKSDNQRLRRRVGHQEREISYLKGQIACKYAFDNIVTASPAMELVLRRVEKAVDTSASVLIEGETGTGKELVARAVHFNGPRREKHFVAQNCAAIPDTILERELFGHVRGAFTSADQSRRGLIEEANEGTLFLDEISETSLSFQATLLRVVQEQEYRPVGSTETRRTNVRFIAATNQNLLEEVRQRRFRKDLYYRLSVFPITLPPLRARREDIPLLSAHFLKRYNDLEGKRVRGIDSRAMVALQRYGWPGNIRELENEIHRLVAIAGDDEKIDIDALSPRIRSAPRNPWEASAEGNLRGLLADAERQILIERLRENQGNKTATARSLGVSRETFYSKLERLGIFARGKKKPPSRPS